MTLLAQLEEDMKTAMRAGERQRLGVLRMLISEVRNVDLQSKKTTQEEAVAAYAKRLRKSQEEYRKLGKEQEVQQLEAELAIVEPYLPQKASSEATERLVEQFLTDRSFTEKQIGQAMGAFMKQHGQEVDPALANELIRRRLAGQ